MVWFKVKLTVDTNVLVRAIVQDDKKQSVIAARILKSATEIAVPLVVLCELVWVLKRVYDFPKEDIAAVMIGLLATQNVNLNRPAVHAGLAVLGAGGDFADGVIAFEGRWLGGETFVSFDEDAIAILKDQGESVKQL